MTPRVLAAPLVTSQMSLSATMGKLSAGAWASSWLLTVTTLSLGSVCLRRSTWARPLCRPCTSARRTRRRRRGRRALGPLEDGARGAGVRLRARKRDTQRDREGRHTSARSRAISHSSSNPSLGILSVRADPNTPSARLGPIRWPCRSSRLGYPPRSPHVVTTPPIWRNRK